MMMPSWPGFFTLWFLIGMGLATVQTPVGALVRASCLASDSPAYFSAQFSLSHFCWFGSYLLAGFIGSSFGLATSFFILGVISLFALLAAWRLYPNPDPVEMEHEHHAYTHHHFHTHDLHHSHEHIQDQSNEGHDHQHSHRAMKHKHRFVIDHHHQSWATPDSK